MAKPPGTPATLPTRVMDFKEFEKSFNAHRRGTNTIERRAATGTLSPAMIERGIRSGKGVKVDEKQGGGVYTADELKAFRKMMQGIQSEFGGNNARGAFPKQMLAKTMPADIERANKQIKYARLYQVRGNLLKFAVPASGESGYNGFYQVRIRMEAWDAALVSGKRWPGAAKQAAEGRVSIDCQCGRHQYWYRYLAGVGGYAVEPPQEKDFPKIRNPTLHGACCKHVVRTLATLASPTTLQVIAKEMERQADAVGYGKMSAKYLNAADHEKLQRARPRQTDQASAAAAYRDYLKSVKGMKKATSKAKETMDAESENKTLRAKDRLRQAQLKKARQENEQLRQQASLSALSAALNNSRMKAVMQAASSGGDPMAAQKRATAEFAEQWARDNNTTADEVASMIKDNGL